ncbi:hypothetical protein AGLY_008417 [Aphis glycines]|uniref:Uncharacterized protein n=1 Tax=Aphis glycines TaxID=307491 RepID=A0A6G0TKU4_APHGL|nr:hypothetical protein AGLY_008417 [Aphis glycines]
MPQMTAVLPILTAADPSAVFLGVSVLYISEKKVRQINLDILSNISVGKVRKKPFYSLIVGTSYSLFDRFEVSLTSLNHGALLITGLSHRARGPDRRVPRLSLKHEAGKPPARVIDDKNVDSVTNSTVTGRSVAPYQLRVASRFGQTPQLHLSRSGRVTFSPGVRLNDFDLIHGLLIIDHHHYRIHNIILLRKFDFLFITPPAISAFAIHLLPVLICKIREFCLFLRLQLL